MMRLATMEELVTSFGLAKAIYMIEAWAYERDGKTEGVGGFADAQGRLWVFIDSGSRFSSPMVARHVRRILHNRNETCFAQCREGKEQLVKFLGFERTDETITHNDETLRVWKWQSWPF